MPKTAKRTTAILYVELNEIEAGALSAIRKFYKEDRSAAATVRRLIMGALYDIAPTKKRNRP